MAKKWRVFVDLLIDKGGYEMVLEGLRNTMIIAILGLLIGIVIGTLIATVHVTPKYRRLPRVLERIVNVYVAFFRGTPMVVQLLVGYYVLFPLAGIKVSSLVTCIVIFGLNSGAYVSEIMRGGFNSVDGGQLEAARALGLGFPISMMKVVVPQAVKNILPTLGNEFITLLKETSVVSFVGAIDLSNAFRRIGDQKYEYIVPYLVMAVVYVVLVFGISMLIRLMERRLAKSDRRR
jgi:polar amino acid transport system permease protein